MKLWHYLLDWKEREELRFVRSMESSLDFHEPIAATNAVFAALWPVMQPLSGGLTIAARPHDSPEIDYAIPVPVRHWRLYGKYPPAHVAISKWVEQEWAPGHHYSEEEIPELTLQALADWLTRAHAQQLPEGSVPLLSHLETHSARARILEDQGPSAELVWGPETYAVPVEKREDGLWVSGPMRESVTSPPIKIELYNDHGVQELEITVYWSPWIEAGFAEAELLRTYLHELEKQGWEAD